MVWGTFLPLPGPPFPLLCSEGLDLRKHVLVICSGPGGQPIRVGTWRGGFQKDHGQTAEVTKAWNRKVSRQLWEQTRVVHKASGQHKWLLISSSSWRSHPFRTSPGLDGLRQLLLCTKAPQNLVAYNNNNNSNHIYCLSWVLWVRNLGGAQLVGLV